MFERAALIHYHEIGLKGRNRANFERRLMDNLAFATRTLTESKPVRISSRVLIRATDPSKIQELCDRAAEIPGVSYVSVAFISSRSEADMNSAAMEAIREYGPFGSFAVDSRRSNTDHPVGSMEMNRTIGQYVVDSTGAKVDLSNPDVTIWVEVVQGDAFIYSRKVPGAGGLPVGSAGKVVALLSAGIDSPVATWRLMKRGAVAIGVHFSGRPQTGDHSERLVEEIGHALERYGGLARIYVVPFGDLQREISLNVHPDLRILLYRRLMVMVAEKVAEFENGKALVTGESLGQVASQTLDNIAAVDDVAHLPILRPLIGTDKLEIIAEARAIGTYELSIQEHDDCCTLFMPRTPETHAKVEQMHSAEVGLDMDRMTADAVAAMSYLEFECPAYRKALWMPEGIEPLEFR